MLLCNVRVPEHAWLYTVQQNGEFNNRWRFLQSRGGRLAGFMQTKIQDVKTPFSSDRKLAFWPQQKNGAFSFNKLKDTHSISPYFSFIYLASFVNSLTKTVFPT